MDGLKPRLFAQLGLAVILTVTAGAQARDADAVLREMRAALGGDAVLDAVKTFSVSGSVTHTLSPSSKTLSLEVFAMLPDHFMSVTRDSSSIPGPSRMDVDIKHYRGFRGDALIWRTDSNIPYPDPGPASADHERREVQSHKREFARLAVALLGKSFAGSPIAFSYVGPETVDNQMNEVVEMRAADDFVMRLYVNQTAHLPSFIAWQESPPVFFTTTATSTAVVRGDQVLSQSSPTFGPTGPTPTPRPDVTWKVVFSDFKIQDGLNWPHRVKEMVGDKVTQDMKLGKFKINPKIDARTFNVGR